MVNEVVWQSVKKNSSFLRKRNGVTLDADSRNPSGRFYAKTSAVTNDRSLDVAVDKSGRVVLLKKNARKSLRSIKHAYETVLLSKYKPGAVNAIRGHALKGLYYRPDQVKYVVKKYYKLLRTSQ
jgi:hypothetical protein